MSRGDVLLVLVALGFVVADASTLVRATYSACSNTSKGQYGVRSSCQRELISVVCPELDYIVIGTGAGGVQYLPLNGYKSEYANGQRCLNKYVFVL